MKKTLAIVLSAAMALGLAACSSGSTASTTAAPAATQAAAPAATQAAAPAAEAVKWAKNYELQVPASAGGGTDVVARAMTNYIGKNCGNNGTVINNTDGGGVIAYETVRNSTAKDGESLVFFHTTMLIKTATKVYQYSAVDPEAFTVITVSQPTSADGYCVVVPGDSPYKTFEEYVNASKEKTLLLGVETGGGTHLMGGMIAQATGAKLEFVEAGPDVDKMTALMGGALDSVLVAPKAASQYIESGKARALVGFSDNSGKRGTVLPDVPTFQELGYDIAYTINFMVLGPKHLDEGLCEEIANDFVAATKDPETAEILKNSGWGVEFQPHKDSYEIVKKQSDALTSVAEELGIDLS